MRYTNPPTHSRCILEDRGPTKEQISLFRGVCIYTPTQTSMLDLLSRTKIYAVRMSLGSVCYRSISVVGPRIRLSSKPAGRRWTDGRTDT